ncbi:TPA: IS66 family insertion sequence element accessory protein TnpB [Escherichia coli]|nr:IS66 family insertion sequence element accessory protein TnpB [Escherichia coli]MCN5903628.1 IS66 family insertion sequence element accessory protein TnpB [Escherichia coli]HAX4637291.1 IS66 family insertion sequence element accessory protein TnpB [Escherichia coli]HCX4876869.1 IS66 family insertion sequence element accessory protein TnpB [Escherichia coli]HCX5233999.1 IS66 family insertion sequence element accessory protein TnpB [Escherichia coli]
MTPAQRRQHYDAWRVSGMSRTAYARHHGINNKTFWHLCRAFSADDARGPAPADNRPAILPVTLSVSDTATLKLQCACVTASPAGIAAIIRELNLC